MELINLDVNLLRKKGGGSKSQATSTMKKGKNTNTQNKK